MNIRSLNLVLAWIGSILGAAIFIRLGITDTFGMDSHAYWLAFQGGELYEGRPEELDAYLYSPAFAQMLYPLGLLPWEIFRFMWLGAGIAAAWWLVKPLPFRYAFPLMCTTSTDLVIGNIYVFLGVMVVLAARTPAVWAFGVLTKVTPGVGILWLLARQEWRKAATAVLVTVGVVAVSWTINPHAWAEWIEMLTTSDAGDPTFIPRCVIAAVIATTIARSRPWWLAVAVVMALPVFNALACLVPLLAIIRLRDDAAPAEPSAPAGQRSPGRSPASNERSGRGRS